LNARFARSIPLEREGWAALGAAYVYAKRFAGAWSAAVITNLVGILDFTVALGAGSRLLAAPLQAVFGGASVTTGLLSVFPLGLIPLFVVPLGFIVHLHSLTKLFGERRRAPRPTTAA
jgi:hypothetical protein